MTQTTPGPARLRPTLLPHQKAKILPTVVLLIGAIYCLIPVAWIVIAATKSQAELFSTFTFSPGTGLLDNLRDLFAYEDGAYGRWALNSLLYAGVLEQGIFNFTQLDAESTDLDLVIQASEEFQYSFFSVPANSTPPDAIAGLVEGSRPFRGKRIGYEA